MTPALTYFLPSIELSKKKTTLFIVVFLLFASLQGQHAKDSLRKEIATLQKQQNFSVKDTAYINLLANLGSELRFYHADSMLLLSKQALKLSKSVEYLHGECKSYFILGNYFSDHGDSAKAIEYLKKANELATEINDRSFAVRIQNDLSGEYAYSGDYSKALNGYLLGIEKAAEINDLKMLSIINENIANLYVSQKDYTQALEFYKKVKKINTKIGDEVIMAETMSNMASVYADMNELEYAMYNINSSISAFEKNEVTDWLAFAYEVKGKIYLKEGKFKWALFWYRQGEMLHNKLQDERGQIDLYNGMAEAYLGQEKDSISKSYALRAFDISQKLNFKEGTQKCASTLYRISKKHNDFKMALVYHELYKSLSDTLSRNENKKSLTMFKTKLKYDKQKQDLILENEKALAKQKNYVYAALGILIIFLAVTFLIRRNEHLQKKLNIELKSNQEELEKSEHKLRELNSTKDKLFSIIGHDLRGPIGAFQGLLKLYKDGEVNQKEFLSFIPKLGADLDHISFTLNNLLSWGQSQMNGAITKPAVISLDNLVVDNIKLLSEIATNKSIKIVSRVSANTLAWSDGNQIDIVIRNLMSNALKFTPENGMITIGASEKTNHWEIYVRDTGVGMDRETQAKIFAENSNHTTYGTNNEKGTGLGLSLCKEMVEKNNGTIWVDSIPRKGSSFFFTLPKAKNEYQKTA
ncbi:ATP-binding protein [Maribacter algicola]|uniref:ATP-binding protein n=1 Tax=Meishania litoralis TaxID=3434685 RepID=A0ACC7LJI0_9FLAO